MNNPIRQTAWERWELGSLDQHAAEPVTPAAPHSPDAGSEAEPPLRLPTAADIELLQRHARDEGYAEGQREGLAAGREAGLAQVATQASHLATSVVRLDKAIEEINSAVADELLALALELGRQVIRRELSLHPESIIQVVKEALGQLPHQHAVIYLHPEDASLVRSYAGDQLAHAGHRILEDLKLGRGDCLLESGGTQVDATVAMRWRRVLAGLGLNDAWDTEANPERERKHGP